ncbi:MAG TPA: winged helix-turn-helix domain-containing protein [Thermoanaerobaculia bacterium]|jgi:DNA-binding winged helix-turn-helix (wHTH) protein/Flp pilus assembly protein TadD|nr:winged helix-turn-helix domain-containing protein [Thermoanaerobaculia bacterium]
MSFTALGCKVDPLLRSVTDASGRTTRLEPKACDLLVLLAGRPGEVVSAEQLIESVWGGRFVTSDVVTVAVHALRQAFGDNARAPRFIETVRGRGYRWIAPLDRPEPAGEEPAAAPRSAVAVASLLALLLLVSAACVWMLLRRPAPLPSMTRTQAVLRAQARGLFFSDRRTLADLDKAIEEFRRAIAGEPRFAEPHAALAEALVRRMEWSQVVTAAEREARHEAARALELDPRSPLGQAARASVELVLDRDMAAAEQSFRRAIELDPTIPSVRRRYSYLLAVNGRFREAVSHTRVAAELAPTSSSTFADLGWVELLAGDAAAAQRDLSEALRLDPANGSATMSLVKCLDATGRETEAWSELHRGLAASGMPPAFVQRSEAAYAAGGLRGVYDTWAESGAQHGLPRFVLAVYTAQAGRRDRALALLRQAVERREPMTLWMTVHPAFAALRHDAEFLALARRAGLGATAY